MASGTWGYRPEFSPVHQGFDTFHGFVSGNIDLFNHIDQAGHEDWWVGDKLTPEAGYMTRMVTDLSIKFINKNKDKPFFLYIPHSAPHYPYQGPNDEGYRKAGSPGPTHGVVKDKERAYKEMVEFMDSETGRIIDELERLKLRRNTLIVFTSDNGGTGKYGSSNAPYSGGKGQFLEGGHRVPCIINWPGQIPAGKVSDEIAMCMDFMPTFIKLADKEADISELDGVDLTPFLIDNKNIQDRYVYWRKGKQYAARHKDWKIVNQNGKVQLYNLKNDPGEKVDLCSKFPEKLEAMQQEYRKWEQTVTAGVIMKSQ